MHTGSPFALRRQSVVVVVWQLAQQVPARLAADCGKIQALIRAQPNKRHSEVHFKNTCIGQNVQCIGQEHFITLGTQIIVINIYKYICFYYYYSLLDHYNFPDKMVSQCGAIINWYKTEHIYM